MKRDLKQYLSNLLPADAAAATGFYERLYLTRAIAGIILSGRIFTILPFTPEMG